MDDPPLEPDSGGEAGERPQPSSVAGTPRWVKVFGIIALVLVLVLIAVFLFGGGDHGPGRHDADSRTGPSGIAEDHSSLGGGLGGRAPRGHRHAPA